MEKGFCSKFGGSETEMCRFRNDPSKADVPLRFHPFHSILFHSCHVGWTTFAI